MTALEQMQKQAQQFQKMNYSNLTAMAIADKLKPKEFESSMIKAMNSGIFAAQKEVLSNNAFVQMDKMSLLSKNLDKLNFSSQLDSAISALSKHDSIIARINNSAVGVDKMIETNRKLSNAFIGVNKLGYISKALSMDYKTYTQESSLEKIASLTVGIFPKIQEIEEKFLKGLKESNEFKEKITSQISDIIDEAESKEVTTSDRSNTLEEKFLKFAYFISQHLSSDVEIAKTLALLVLNHIWVVLTLGSIAFDQEYLAWVSIALGIRQKYSSDKNNAKLHSKIDKLLEKQKEQSENDQLS